MALQSAVVNPVGKKNNRNRKSQFLITSEDLTGTSSRETIKALIGNISYPSDVVITKLSPNMTRVAQPFNMIQLMSEPNITFSLALDPIKAFDVTAKGGIIFIKDTNALNRVISGIY